MRSERAPVRLVLDTNVWIDWLVFDDPGVACIRDALAAQRAEIWIDAHCEAELERALAYEFGKRTLGAEAQAARIALCRASVRRIESAPPETERARLPVCRDPDDQKFLEATLAAGAAFLVTRDRALLELEPRAAKGRAAPFRILTPAQFAAV
jgi:putative PIN family toxin of toxin-antitoxin system